MGEEKEYDLSWVTATTKCSGFHGNKKYINGVPVKLVRDRVFHIRNGIEKKNFEFLKKSGKEYLAYQGSKCWYLSGEDGKSYQAPYGICTDTSKFLIVDLAVFFSKKLITDSL